jgi:hypothetical protein
MYLPSSIQSGSLISARVPSGEGEGLTVKVVSGGQTAIALGTWTYDGPILTSTNIHSSPSVGGVIVRLFGSNLGLALSTSTYTVRVYSDSCDSIGRPNGMCGSTSNMITHTPSYVDFLMPPGIGYYVWFTYQVNDRAESPSPTNQFVYDGPIITRVSGCEDIGNATRSCPIEGGITISVCVYVYIITLLSLI